MGGLFGEPEAPIVQPAAVPVPAAAASKEEEKKDAKGKKEADEEDKGEGKESTTEADRKVAFIAKIENLDPIKGSETLEVAKILGWTVVVKKDAFKVNDLVVYFTLGAVPDPSNAAFDHLKVKGRMKQLKSKKVKGVLSQGAIVPLDTVKSYGVEPASVQVGQDMSAVMKVRKGVDEEEADVYVKDLPEQEPFPSFIPRTEEERLQNIPDVLKELAGQPVIVTRKEDGCSASFALNAGRVYICSRNNIWNKRTKASSQVYTIAEKYKLPEALKQLGRNIGIQGEIVGPGISENRLGLKDKEFRVFNVFDIDAQAYLGHAEMLEVCQKLGLNTVPVVYTGTLPADWLTVEDVLKYVETIKYTETCPAEGIVVKTNRPAPDKRISFKLVSNLYLTKYHT